MRKWIIGGAMLAATIIVVGAVVVNINSLIMRNKDYLIGQAEQALGRKITVGDVEATIWNGIGVRLSNFALADDPTYGSEDFVRARDLQVNLKLWPLLKRDVQIKRLILHDPVVRVIRNAKGEFNFSTIGSDDGTRQKKETVAKEKRQRQPRDASPAGFLMSMVDISGGDIRYIDRGDGTDLQFRQVDLQVEDLDVNQPFSVKLAAAVYADKQNLNVRGKLGPLPANGSWADIPLDGEADIDAVDLNRLKAAAPKLRDALSKEFDVSGVFRVKDLKLKGALKNFAVQGDLEGTQGSIRYGKSFNKPAGVPLSLAIAGQYAGNKITISQSVLKLHTLELASAGDIHLSDAITAFNLSVHSRPASLEGWDKFVPGIQRYRLKGFMELQATVRGNAGRASAPQIQGVLTLKNASAQPPDFPKAVENLDTTVKFTGQRADIGDTTLSLGKARIRVAAAIEKFSPLTFSYKMSTPELWPADYKTSLSEERKGDIIRNLRSEGQFTMAGNNIVYRGKVVSADGTLLNIAYKDLQATLSLADKVANVQNLQVQAFSGTVQLQGDYAFKDPSPAFTLNSKVDGIDVKELYSALDAKAERDIQGRLNGHMKLSGTGRSWEEIKPTLRGQGEAEVVQGVIYNFNIAEGALTGITGIAGLTDKLSPSLRKKYPETFSAKDTEFKELKTLVDVGDGRINFKNMRMSAAEFVAVGNGWADFNRRVDSRATLTFSQRLSSDLAQSTREIKYLLNNQGQLEIPFSVRGRMPNVKAKPDANFLGQTVQRNFMRRGTDDLQNRFLGPPEPSEENNAPEESTKKKRSSTEDRIRRGLENLFRR